MQKFGWKGPEPKDPRDLKYRVVKGVPPKTCDLRTYCSPVEDQGDLGSCTANAGVALDEYLMKKDKKPFYDMSRLHLYWWTRFIEGTTGEDSGAYIRDTVKSLQKYGVCKESTWPYIISKFTQKPSTAANDEAMLYQIIRYESVPQTLVALKTCLGIDKRPAIFGFDVPESFLYVGKSGTWTPKKNESIVGGHAQVLVGYTATRFILRNSWGTSWGNKGYCTVPYSFILSNACTDFWCVYTGEQM
jgi:C1A family cysteine protease